MKFPTGPMSFTDLLRMQQEVSNPVGLLCRDLGTTTRTGARGNAVNPPLVEPAHPSGHRILVHPEQLGCLPVGKPHSQGLDSHKPNIRPLYLRRPGRSLQLLQRTILRVGHVVVS